MNFYQVKQFGKYALKARNEHAVHSPFLFSLLQNAFYKPSESEELRKLDSWFNTLKRSKKSFVHTDFGAGSTSGKGAQREVGEYTQKVSKSKKYRHLLFHLSKELKVASILELGTATGVSGAYLNSGSRNATLLSLEGCPSLSEVSANNWRELGLKNVSILTGNFDQTISHNNVSSRKYDLVYLDGNHQYEPTMRYFNSILPLLSEKACILVDDIYWSLEMTTAWEAIKANQAVQQTVDIFQMGLVFINPDLKKQDFTIRY